MTIADVARLTGIPWRRWAAGPDGCDCYGLVRLFFAEIRGIQLPAYPDRWLKADHPGFAAAAAGAGPWLPVARPRFGDVVVVDGGAALHCGVVVSPARMLHVPIDGSSRVESYKGRRVIGEYRWAP